MGIIKTRLCDWSDLVTLFKCTIVNTSLKSSMKNKTWKGGVFLPGNNIFLYIKTGQHTLIDNIEFEVERWNSRLLRQITLEYCVFVIWSIQQVLRLGLNFKNQKWLKCNCHALKGLVADWFVYKALKLSESYQKN